jgi:single-strand DNA-binding protein
MGANPLMAQLNKCFLMGNLTRDPELKRLPNGNAVTTLNLAMNRKYQSHGEMKEEVTFVDVTVWERQAENCVEFLRKGSPVHVEGALKLDQWEDKATGERRSKLKVQADRVQFLDRRKESK